MTLPSRISPMARTWSGMVDWWTFFLVIRFPVFFGGWKVLGWKPPWWKLADEPFWKYKASLLLNMKFSFFGECDWEGETWQLSYQATLKTVFLPKFRNPKLWNGQSFGDAMKTLYWLTTWNHTNQLGPLFTFMDSTLTMFRQYPNHQCEIQLSVSMFPHFVLNLLWSQMRSPFTIVSEQLWQNFLQLCMCFHTFFLNKHSMVYWTSTFI